MAKNTSISLGPHFERFIRREVASGRFGTASEVVRAGLRLLEEDEARLASLRGALEEGERSGVVEDYSLEGLLAETAPKKR
jgi:antitoxin ParD1/3/4